jgi:hypothetical protein
MSRRKSLASYYSLYEITPARNGLKYDNSIDIAIVEALFCSGESGSSELGRKVQKNLHSSIKDKTYYNHLKRLQKEDIISKRDTGRGKKVYYSLTKRAKQRAELRLLRTYCDFNSLKKIYVNLLLRAIVEPEQSVYSNVKLLLSYLRITRNDLKIDHIEKVRSEGILENLEKPIKFLPLRLIFRYKPILDSIQITETITYCENTQTHCICEESQYYLSISGVKRKDFANTYYTFKPKEEDVETAFDLLLKSGLIIKKEFLGEDRYYLADNELQELIVDIKKLDKIKREENYVKLTYYKPPSDEEINERRVLYTDEKLFRKYFNKKEEQRHENKKLLREQKDNNELANKFERYAKTIHRNTDCLITAIKEKHRGALEKYAFLYDIIGTRYPSLFE